MPWLGRPAATLRRLAPFPRSPPRRSSRISPATRSIPPSSSPGGGGHGKGGPRLVAVQAAETSTYQSIPRRRWTRTTATDGGERKPPPRSAGRTLRQEVNRHGAMRGGGCRPPPTRATTRQRVLVLLTGFQVCLGFAEDPQVHGQAGPAVASNVTAQQGAQKLLALGRTGAGSA